MQTYMIIFIGTFTEPVDTERINIGLIVGVVVGGVLFIIMTVLSFAILKRLVFRYASQIKFRRM